MTKYVEGLRTRDPDQFRILMTLREDYDYSFVEYQGANLTHWGFGPDDEDAKRIKASFVCAHAFLIADGDVRTKGEREGAYRAMLGERFFILSAKEIENLIPPEVLRKLVDGEFQRRARSTEAILQNDFSKDNLGLGAHLDSLLDLKSDETVFAAESGTIKNKASFCERAVQIMSDPELQWQLTPTLETLCKKIFDHILSQRLD